MGATITLESDRTTASLSDEKSSLEAMPSGRLEHSLRLADQFDVLCRMNVQYGAVDTSRTWHGGISVRPSYPQSSGHAISQCLDWDIRSTPEIEPLFSYWSREAIWGNAGERERERYSWRNR